jgi:hypothetical protein
MIVRGVKEWSFFELPSGKNPDVTIYFMSVHKSPARHSQHSSEEDGSLFTRSEAPDSFGDSSGLDTQLRSMSLATKIDLDPARVDSKAHFGGILGQLRTITYESGPHDQFRCSLCDSFAVHRVNVASQRIKNGKFFPKLLPIYHDTQTDEWVMPFFSMQGDYSEDRAMTTQSCGAHMDTLGKLAKKMHGKSGYDSHPNFLRHESQGHLNLHLMTLEELNTVAEEQLSRT